MQFKSSSDGLHPPRYYEDDVTSIYITRTRVSRGIALRSDELDVEAWLNQLASSLHDFARAYPFDVDAEDYYVHITTGSHVAQICLFLLTESRHIPGRLLQTNPPPRR